MWHSNLVPDYELGLSGVLRPIHPAVPQFSTTLGVFGVDGKATFGALEVQAEYIYTHFSNISKVANSLAQVAFTQAAAIPATASPDLEVELAFQLVAGLATVQEWRPAEPPLPGFPRLAAELDPRAAIRPIRSSFLWCAGSRPGSTVS